MLPTVRWRSWTPSANSSIILRLKAGISSGLRLVTRPLIAHHLLVDPVCAGILEVGLDRSYDVILPAAHHAGLDQRPRAVADRRDRLAGVEERFDELRLPACSCAACRGSSRRRAAAARRSPPAAPAPAAGRPGTGRPTPCGSSPSPGLWPAKRSGSSRRPARAPACGSVSSTCSKPSATRMATRLPLSC